MTWGFRKKISQGNRCHFAPLCAALLSLVCFALPMNGPCLVPAARSAEVEEGWFDLTITDQDGIPLPGFLTLETKERNVPYLFHITAPGTATGYCKVTVSREGQTDVRYIYPICPGDDITLALYAAAGSDLSLDYSQGDLCDVDPSAQIEAPAPSHMEDGSLQVCLEISETPSLFYTVPQGAALEAIAAHYGVSAGDILRFNAVDSIQAGDEIAIPNPATQEPYEVPRTYTVVKGDTLQAIADAHGVTVKSLCQWNDISRGTILYEGMELEIPILYDEEPEEEAVETQPAETEPVEPQQPEIREVPLYFQNDYPNVRYGAGTVKTSGCSVVSLTMVANAVTGYDYTVDELADYFGGRAENNMARLEKGSRTLGLEFHKSKNWQESLTALREGKIVIALMDGMSKNCLFTNSQHFIVLTGMTEDGERILVNDSNKSNYSLWNLKNGFQNGFLPGDILMGYSGGWIYERTLEQQPERYREERLLKTPENCNYPQLHLTEEEMDLLACLVWAESRGESEEGQQAVAEVVLNRLASDKFSNNLHDVIYGEGQFRSVSVLEDAQPGQAQYQAIDRAMYGKSILPKNVFYFATFKTNANVYQQIGNHIFCFG